MALRLGIDARGERPLVVAQHVRQPVAAFREHLREQPLDVVPAVVDAIEQQLDVRGERLICLTEDQHATRCPVIQLLRPLGYDERATRLRRDGAAGSRASS